MPAARRSGEFYSDEAAQAILKKALELRAADRFSGEQLREMAAELDISPDLLDAAISDWAAQAPPDTPKASVSRANQGVSNACSGANLRSPAP